jgi:hypothetical protein
LICKMYAKRKREGARQFCRDCILCQKSDDDDDTYSRFTST